MSRNLIIIKIFIFLLTITKFMINCSIVMELSDLAKIFKALSNEQRLKLFYLLYEWQKEEFNKEGEKKCCFGVEKAFTKACNCVNLSRSTISHHIKELQNAGLVECTRNGQMLYCKVNDEVIKSIKNFIK